MDLVFEAILWTLVATIIAQLVTIILLWMLGLKPQLLTHEIEDAQNAAVGAAFFIVSFIASIFVSVLASDGFTQSDYTSAESAAWIIGGTIGASFYSLALFWIAFRVMQPLEGETLYSYLQRELIAEQNAALAFLLGGLAVAPFMAVLFQII
ncbi:MAG: hypothetical protein K8I82_29405 [Anaerolineae bacterium]|nr:hypothetical protein [Anaerolineae bacterium]